ncbi:hypothetical protein ACIRPP_26800 [Streptomyces sp. NPDC101219]|uniref:hypothetical protein n=1 Tax=Streptomyces sp. NPDC101219 TaxID=3366131 RepID=UPI0037F85F4E
MSDSSGSKTVQEFRPAQYTAPYLLLIVGRVGSDNAPFHDRPVLFCLFAAVAALGLVLAVGRLRLMWGAHRDGALPAWTRFLGLLLALYGVYVTYRVVTGAAA